MTMHTSLGEFDGSYGIRVGSLQAAEHRLTITKIGNVQYFILHDHGDYVWL